MLARWPDLMGDVCGDCGQVHKKCAGHKKHVVPLRPCGANPRAGSPVCDSHGGAAPQVKAKAADRVREMEAASAVARWALPVDVDPGEALLGEVRRTAGVVAWLDAQVQRVMGDSADNLIRGTRSIKRTDSAEHGLTTVTEAGPGVHEWLKLWQAERSHLVKVASAALAAGVQERIVKAVEAQAEQFGQLIAGLADDLALTGAARDDLFGKAQHRFQILHGGQQATG